MFLNNFAQMCQNLLKCFLAFVNYLKTEEAQQFWRTWLSCAMRTELKQTTNGTKRNINNLLNLTKHEVRTEKNIETVSIISDQSNQIKIYHYLFYSFFLP